MTPLITVPLVRTTVSKSTMRKREDRSPQEPSSRPPFPNLDSLDTDCLPARQTSGHLGGAEERPEWTGKACHGDGLWRANPAAKGSDIEEWIEDRGGGSGNSAWSDFGLEEGAAD